MYDNLMYDIWFFLYIIFVKVTIITSEFWKLLRLFVRIRWMHDGFSGFL